MKSYRSLLESVHGNICGREDIEWSNFWYDRANGEDARRILLVGDSTSRMVRSRLAKELNEPVDLLGTSSGLHDSLFCSQVDAFFECGRRYDAVFIQLGNHSRVNDDGETYQTEDYDRFGRDLRALITFLQQYSDRIILETVFFCVKPLGKISSWIERTFRIKLEEYDENINSNSRQKNLMIRQVAQELGVELLDVNATMMNSNCMRIDHIHFERRTVHAIVKIMSGQLQTPYHNNKSVKER